MRHIFSTAFFAAAVILLGSCTKVINVKINDSAKKYVIEGVLTDQPGTCQVHITQTKNFNENNTFDGVTASAVTITDNSTGLTTTLNAIAPGYYSDTALTAISGKTYTLRVNIGNETFTAVSAMPQRVNVDTVFFTKDNVFGDTWTLANLDYTDPAGFGNNYQVKQYINGKKMKDIFITNDDYTDGKHNVAKLYVDPGTDDKDRVKAGDTVKVEILCINTPVYKYWFSLQQSATGTNQSAAPANPVTNIDGGALGYFSTHTLQTVTVVAP